MEARVNSEHVWIKRARWKAGTRSAANRESTSRFQRRHHSVKDVITPLQRRHHSISKTSSLECETFVTRSEEFARTDLMRLVESTQPMRSGQDRKQTVALVQF